MSCKCTDGHCEERLALYAKSPCTAVLKTSTIPNSGQGLFADKDYKKGEFVTYYSGTVTNVFIEGDRVLEINKKSWIDGTGPCTRSTALGDYINHCLPVNVKFCISSHKLNTVCIRTTKAVEAGTEFFINYGRDYWARVPNTKKSKLI